MNYTSALQAILDTDPLRRHALDLIRSLDLPDCWIGAGFIRNAIWDYLHDRAASRPAGDIDVIWFHPERADQSQDRRLEARLQALEPSVRWSVKNQARMHARNGDARYASAVDAMRCWPETATAVAARQTGRGNYEISAPFGVEDLFALMLRPTPRFRNQKRHIYLGRVRTKGWLQTWPLLRLRDG